MKPVKNNSLSLMVKEAIFSYIKENEFKNDKLPKEEALCEMLNVSRITVRSALKDLASEGFIFSRHGKGTFINKKALKINSPLSPLKPFEDIIVDLSYECTIDNLGHEFLDEVPGEISEALELQPGEKCIITRKVFFADGKPVVYCIDYFSTGILPDLAACERIEDYEKSIFKFFSLVCGQTITWDLIELSTTSTLKTPGLREIFQCSEEFKDFLVCRGINYNDDNKPICYNYEYIDTDYIPFNLIRKKHF